MQQLEQISLVQNSSMATTMYSAFSYSLNTTVPGISTGQSLGAYTAFVRRFFVVATIIPSLLEAILCGLVVFAAIRIQAYRSALNLLVVSAAAFDFVRGLHCVFAPALFYNPVEKTEPNERICQCYLWIHLLQYCWSMWSITLIAFSRYDLVARPFHRWLSVKKAIVCISCVVVEGIVFASLPLVGWNRYGLVRLHGDSHYRCAIVDPDLSGGHRAYLPVFYVFNFALPLVLVVIFYAMIVPIAMHHRRRSLSLCSSAVNSLSKLGSASGTTSPQQDRQVRKRRSAQSGVSAVVCSKAFCYVTCIVVSNLVLTTPYIVSEMLLYLDIYRLEDLTMTILKFVFTINFLVNSCFYVLWVRDLRHGLFRSLGCGCLRSRSKNCISESWRSTSRRHSGDHSAGSESRKVSRISTEFIHQYESSVWFGCLVKAVQTLHSTVIANVN